MGEWLSQYSPTELIGLVVPIVAIVVGGLIAMVAIICGSLHATRTAEAEASLKRDMLNRGMSAGEIEQVVRASRGKSWDSKVCSKV